MKKIFLPLFLLFITISLRSQQLLITFSKEKNQFMRDMNTFMTSNKMEQNVNCMNAFEKMVKEGKVPDTWFEKIARDCNSMTGRNMSPFTHFVPFLNAIMNAAQTK